MGEKRRPLREPTPDYSIDGDLLRESSIKKVKSEGRLDEVVEADDVVEDEGDLVGQERMPKGRVDLALTEMEEK